MFDARDMVAGGMIIQLLKYTLGTGLWRLMEFYARWHGLKHPTCFNGSIHWLAFDSTRGIILSFNLESERFHLFPSPLVRVQITSIEHISFREFEGCLYIFSSSSSGYADLWAMMEYGVGESWTKVVSIDTNGGQRWPYGLYQPIIGSIGHAILIYHSCNYFIYCDPLKRQLRHFKVRGTRFNLGVIAHTPSLISLKDAVEGDNIEVLNVHSRCAAFKLREEKVVLFLAQEKCWSSKLVSSTSPDDDEEY